LLEGFSGILGLLVSKSLWPATRQLLHNERRLFSSSNRRSDAMKALVPALALLLVVAFSLPAFAATSKSACQKAGGVWDAKTSKCVVKPKKKSYYY
jgi:hypothetical protein